MQTEWRNSIQKEARKVKEKKKQENETKEAATNKMVELNPYASSIIINI